MYRKFSEECAGLSALLTMMKVITVIALVVIVICICLSVH